MRYFQRQALFPAIQEQLSGKTTQVFLLSKSQRKEVVKQLMDSQKELCCYCECRIFVKDAQTRINGYHIEHFEEQHEAPDRIFDYENMLLSCEGNKNLTNSENQAQIPTSCGQGKEKDRHKGDKIDYDLLLNPINNVSALFSYLDGVIEPTLQCSDIQKRQVEYTIKRLNLDVERLTEARRSQINLILKQLNDLSEGDQRTFIRSLLDETQAVLNPYFSTIKDNFGFMLLP